MEVANADGFVFKRRRKEETSTSAQVHNSGHPEENPSHKAQAREAYPQAPAENRRSTIVQEDVQHYDVHSKDNGAVRRKSYIAREETNFPPYPVGGAVILPDDDSGIAEGERLNKLCTEICSNEARNVSRTFVGKTEAVSHIIEATLEKFESRVRELVLTQNIKFLSKESQALNARKQTMKRLVESLRGEVKTWSEIENVDQDAANHDYIEEEAKGRECAKKGSAVNQLTSAYNSTLLNLDTQVNSLCSVVDSVEALCGEAEDLNRELQCKYHKKTFNPFPHVNSPATLIKSLIKPIQ